LIEREQDEIVKRGEVERRRIVVEV
jgi:hypothetical protein